MRHIITRLLDLTNNVTYFQGRELSHNVGKGVIILDNSLVLQKVSKTESGVYTCTAHNSEGDGVSNSFRLNVRCKYLAA